MTASPKSRGLPAWHFAVLIAASLPIAAYTLLLSFQEIARSVGTFDDPAMMFSSICALAIMAFGALVLAKGRDNRGAALLGAILIAFSRQVSPSPEFDSSMIDAGAVAFLLLVVLSSGLIGYLWPLFSLEITGGPTSRLQSRIVHALAILSALLPIAALWVGIVERDAALSAGIWLGMTIGNQLLGYWILIRNYRRNDAAGRNRIKIAFVAFVLFLLASQVAIAVSVLDMLELKPLNPALALAATAPLAYATLRHRLFDFGFALNRTLVYAALSFILLLAFGLAEWSVEHLIPEAWHEGGPLISVAIALALFLSFHRLRDWVEKHIERLLFSKWHRNEAALRRFIGAADHFGSSAALERAFTAEVSRFSGGAEAAIYLRASDGHYALQAGKLAKAGRRYADDDRALALMRAERGPVDIAHAHSALPGELALPLLDQGALLGFVLLGAKPDGAPYRPDETEVLGWAAQQVGFAAQAQHVRQLEGTIADLRAEVAALSKGRRAARAA